MEELTPTINHPYHPNRQKDTPEKMSIILQRRSSSKRRLKKRKRDRRKKYELVKFDSVPESGAHGGITKRHNKDSKPDEWIIVSPATDTKSQTGWEWIVQTVTIFFKF
tara:strand:- start:1100 stop:1423 length:324 start_codon:yes stop_codon:yes gene_type:complete